MDKKTQASILPRALDRPEMHGTLTIDGVDILKAKEPKQASDDLNNTKTIAQLNNEILILKLLRLFFIGIIILAAINLAGV